jgi:hypothetical protein
MNKDSDFDKGSADAVINPYPAVLVDKNNFPIGSLMWIDGQPMEIVAVEDDEQYGFSVFLKKTDQIENRRKLGAWFTQRDS